MVTVLVVLVAVVSAVVGAVAPLVVPLGACTATALAGACTVCAGATVAIEFEPDWAGCPTASPAAVNGVAVPLAASEDGAAVWAVTCASVTPAWTSGVWLGGPTATTEPLVLAGRVRPAHARRPTL